MTYDDPNEIDIPPEAAAVIFHTDGTVSLALPKSVGDPENGDRPVTDAVLAATEVLFMINDGDLTIKDLANAMEARVKQ